MEESRCGEPSPPTSPTRLSAEHPRHAVPIALHLRWPTCPFPRALTDVLADAAGRRSRQLIGAAPEGGAAAPVRGGAEEGSTPALADDEEASSGKDRALFVVRGRGLPVKVLPCPHMAT